MIFSIIHAPVRKVVIPRTHNYFESLTHFEDHSKISFAEEMFIRMNLLDKTNVSQNVAFSLTIHDSIFQSYIDALHIWIDKTDMLHCYFVDTKVAYLQDKVILQQTNSIPSQLHQPFNTETGPLSRFYVDMTAKTIYINIHHSIVDFTSLYVMFNHINEIRTTNTFTTDTYSYRDYARMGT